MTDSARSESGEQQLPDDATELVMQKEGTSIRVWAVVDGEMVFDATPHIGMSMPAIKAAVQTFISRGWQRELEAEMDLNDAEDNGGLFNGFR